MPGCQVPQIKFSSRYISFVVFSLFTFSFPHQGFLSDIVTLCPFNSFVSFDFSVFLLPLYSSPLTFSLTNKLSKCLYSTLSQGAGMLLQPYIAIELPQTLLLSSQKLGHPQSGVTQQSPPSQSDLLLLISPLQPLPLPLRLPPPFLLTLKTSILRL